MSELPQSSQINLVSLLLFDRDHALTIRGAVNLDLFEDDFQTAASAAYRFLDQYSAPPGEGHIHECLSLPLASSEDDTRQANLRQCLDVLHQTWKAGINTQFVLDQLECFIQVQSRKQAVQDSLDLLTRSASELDTPAKFDMIMRGVESNALNLTDTGISPFEESEALGFLDKIEPAFTTGVNKFDQLGAGPSRKELHIFVALPGMGKSHWLINLGLRAWRENYNVLHVTLEMSEQRVQQRYLQSALAIPSRRISNPEVVRLDIAKDGTLDDIRKESIQYNFSLDDPDARAKIRKALSGKFEFQAARTKKLKVKEFPSGTLTVPQLSAFLDSLKQQEGFIPDLLIVDYADLMSLSVDKMRESLDRIYVNLRGLASQLNMAVATASQSNRKGMERGGVSMATLAEHFGKGMTADTVITYNQTPMERRLGLARLRLEKCRNAEDKFEVLVNQRYSLCQFVTQSVYHRADYQEEIQEAAEAMGLTQDEIEKYTSKTLYVDDGGD